MSRAEKQVFAVALLVALGWALAPEAAAQAPIRVGATVARSGAYAATSQDQLRGYQLCVKHTNEKDGVLGRKLELLVYDDASDAAAAVRRYEQLITQDKVDLVLGPYGSAVTDPVATVTEKHKMPMVAAAPATSIYRKGRKFIFNMTPPAEIWLEGLIDLAAKKGLRTVVLVNRDDLFGRAVTQGTIELARKKGLQVVFASAYAPGSTDFSAVLAKVQAANPDVLGSTAGGSEGAMAIIGQLKALNVNPRMIGLTAGGGERFYEDLGRDAEFLYGAVLWLPELVEVRAGGLIPIARQYPGAREFVESYKREFPGADVNSFAAVGYGGCQVRPASASGGYVKVTGATDRATAARGC